MPCYVQRRSAGCSTTLWKWHVSRSIQRVSVTAAIESTAVSGIPRDEDHLILSHATTIRSVTQADATRVRSCSRERKQQGSAQNGRKQQQQQQQQGALPRPKDETEQRVVRKVWPVHTRLVGICDETGCGEMGAGDTGMAMEVGRKVSRPPVACRVFVDVWRSH